MGGQGQGKAIKARRPFNPDMRKASPGLPRCHDIKLYLANKFVTNSKPIVFRLSSFTYVRETASNWTSCTFPMSNIAGP